MTPLPTLSDCVFVDTETTGLNPNEPGFQCRYVGALDGRTGEAFGGAPSEVLARLSSLGDAGKTFVCFNLHYDAAVLEREGLCSTALSRGQCAYLAALFALPGERSYGLKDLAARYLSADDTAEDEELRAWAKAQRPRIKVGDRFKHAPLELLAKYCAKDVELCAKLWIACSERLARDPDALANYEIERRVLPHVIAMERCGFGVGRKELEESKAYLSATVATAEEQLAASFPGLNVRSNQALARALWDLGVKLPYTSKGALSTASDALHRIRDNPRARLLAERVLQLRRIDKLLKTYVKPIERWDRGAKEGWRVHAIFNTNGAERTGRFSSEDPNLQNIPRPDEDQRYKPTIMRGLFVPRGGRYLVCVDYKQMEIYVAAIRSQDKLMLEILASGSDFHARTAEAALGEVNKTARSIAKTMNFLLQYGGGADTLRAKLGNRGIERSRGQCQEYMRKYWDTFTGVSALFDEVEREVARTGGVRSLFGRFYAVPKREAYKGVNYIVQGSCATVVKLGIIRAAPILERAGIDLVLQVHDELVLEVPDEILPSDPVFVELKRILENPREGLVLPVDFSICRERWSHKEPMSVCDTNTNRTIAPSAASGALSVP